MGRSNSLTRAAFACLLAAGGALGQTGTVIELIRDGAWCWFQDERAVVDTIKEKLIVGSSNKSAGVDVAIYNLKTKILEGKKTVGKLDSPDDHNSPGLLVGPDGRYVAMWAHHYDKYKTHYSIHNGTDWSAEKTYDWNQIPGGTNYTIAYSNVYYLSSLKRMFVFARANERAPNFLYSDDNGNTWKFGGQLTTNGSSTYNKGYYKYWSNGVDRIDMVFTEQHPRDTTTSIYHGYIKGNKTYSTDGKVVDEDIYERTKIPTFKDFTKVFADSTKVNGIFMTRCWQSDLMRYDDGTIAILFEARANESIQDHRNFYARFDGTSWKTTYIGKAGGPMYADEQDYTGLGALSPDHPNRIYLSSPYNPGNDASTPKKREIWRGLTTDNGATWKWEAVTSNSTVDNFRPIVPKWKPGKEALLWFRGTYQTAQIYTTDVVGMIFDNVAISTGIGSVAPRASPDYSIVSGSGQITVHHDGAQPPPTTLQLLDVSGKAVTGVLIASEPDRTTFQVGDVPTGLYLCKVGTGARSEIVPVTIAR